jgi:RimJ/RimL family protein N-acetyltransferase
MTAHIRQGRLAGGEGDLVIRLRGGPGQRYQRVQVTEQRPAGEQDPHGSIIPEPRSFRIAGVVEIVTERLRLRPFERQDLPAFVAYRSAPEVARYQSWDETFSMADAERFLAEQQEAGFGEPGAWVQLAAIDRGTGELVGDCAVRIPADQPATAEVGVTFAPQHQGRGLAHEALAAVLATLFAELGIHRIHAETDDRNVAVHRLLEGLGFRCEARLVEADWFKGEWSTLRVYAILRREWAS